MYHLLLILWTHVIGNREDTGHLYKISCYCALEYPVISCVSERTAKLHRRYPD